MPPKRAKRPPKKRRRSRAYDVKDDARSALKEIVAQMRKVATTGTGTAATQAATLLVRLAQIDELVPKGQETATISFADLRADDEGDLVVESEKPK